MKFKSKKHFKTLIFFSVVILVLGTIVTFIGVFFNKPLNIKGSDENKDNNSNNGNINNDKDLIDEQYTTLDIANTLINKTEVISLTYFDSNNQKYYFSKSNIDKNILDLINVAISLTEDFNDDISNFIKNIKYKLKDNNTQLIVNIYLYSKLIKQKKYKSFFKLYIV